MIEQKDRQTVSEYWDTTGEWRLHYFENLKRTPDEQLNPVLRAEKEFALTEERVLNGLLREAKSVLELGCGVGRSILNEIAGHPEISFVDRKSVV
jgi:tRNA G46 methylase TrmB